MRLRYAGACRVCGVELPAKVEAIYERTTKTVRCVSHDVHPAVEPAVVEVVDPAVVEVVESGTAGASARREFERRKAKREERIRTKHPKLGGLMLAVSDDQQSTTAGTSAPLEKRDSARASTGLPQTRSGCCMTGGSREARRTSTTWP
jgi:hypothetical protein